jgi:hypothetical protein
MFGYFKDGVHKIKFCIDSADAPYLFDKQALKKVDIYFKMQCPKDITNVGFQLTDDIIIPWCDHKHKDSRIHNLTDRGERSVITDIEHYSRKIRPLIIGFRRLSYSNSFKSLQKAYENYARNINRNISGKLMCYFGNAFGPIPTEGTFKPDYDWESDIVGYYKDLINHPNEKRAIVAKIINEKGKGYDARVINEGFSDSKKGTTHKNLIVPLKDFCTYVSKFEYNMNVSGYRMSIPNRFYESFVVGTAILTDKLTVKWYLPFDEEVVETVKMGYLPLGNVDWNQFKNDLGTLPHVEKSKIHALFERKWSPLAVCEYIVRTCHDEIR